MMDEDIEFLRELADRITRVPVMYGVDQGDTDELYAITRRMENHYSMTAE